jgi:hypothetical protein
MGVPYSIGFASRHPETLSGLVLLDYPARHPKYTVGWAERWASEPSIMDRPDRIKALLGIENESSEVLLWEDLDRIGCPVLVIGEDSRTLSSRKSTLTYTINIYGTWR